MTEKDGSYSIELYSNSELEDALALEDARYPAGRLVIEKDSETGKFIHKLVDPNTGEVVRQWPDESWLEFAKMHGAPNGLWVNQTA